MIPHVQNCFILLHTWNKRIKFKTYFANVKILEGKLDNFLNKTHLNLDYFYLCKLKIYFCIELITYISFRLKFFYSKKVSRFFVVLSFPCNHAFSSKLVPTFQIMLGNWGLIAIQIFGNSCKNANKTLVKTTILLFQNILVSQSDHFQCSSKNNIRDRQSPYQ